MKKKLSAKAMQEAKELFPGGVNSPVRAFQSVGGEPVVMESASGPFLTDLDGNIYIDYIGSWGPMIAGHNHPSVVQKIQQQLKKGISFGTPCPTRESFSKGDIVADAASKKSGWSIQEQRRLCLRSDWPGRQPEENSL